MSKENMPNLSALADTGWDDFSAADLDALVEQESGFQNQQTNQQFPQASTQIQNAPTTTHQQPTVQQPAANPEKELQEFLNNDVHGATPTQDTTKHYLEGGQQQMGGQFQDSGTIHGNQPQTQQQQQQPEDVYDVAFTLLRELDLIRLPENVGELSQKDLVNFAQQTRHAQMNEAVNAVRGEVMHDPFMRQMFDYAYHGGRFADIPRMSELLHEEVDYSSLNLDSEEIQKQLLKRYYADGLDYNDPRDAELIELIPSKIEKLAEELKLKEEAVKAQQFFIQELQKEQQEEQQRVLFAKQQEEQILAQQQAEVQQWQQQFMQHLQKNTWSQAKKEAVYNETLGVRLQDGSIVPQWQFKHDMIMNDPYLFQYFLNFVSYFDPQSMDFVQKQSEEALDNKTVNQVLNRINSKQKQQQQTYDQRPPTNPNQVKSNPTVNVGKDWFL